MNNGPYDFTVSYVLFMWLSIICVKYSLIDQERVKSGPNRGKRLPITRRYDLMCLALCFRADIERSPASTMKGIECEQRGNNR
jgi:hypothetical protein